MTHTDFPAKTSPLLQVHDLQGQHAGPFSLELAAGECIAIQGPSGAGKSVFLRMLADLEPGTGEVLLNGRPAESWSGPEWRRQVVYQSAEPAWWEPTAGAHFDANTRPQLLASLDALRLDAGILDADLARVSTGERQRLALLRSLACHPKVLLLDEPTAALDQATTRAVEVLLCEHMRRGLAIIWVTHSDEQASRIGARRFDVPGKREVAR